jgi:hypothetical protein
MRNLLLIITLIIISGCQVYTGDYREGIKDKSIVMVGEECVQIIEDKNNQIILAKTCEGQSFKEGLTMIATLWLTVPSYAGKRSIRTYRMAVEGWLEENNKDCVIEDTLELFDIVIIGAEVYLSCNDSSTESV